MKTRSFLLLGLAALLPVLMLFTSCGGENEPDVCQPADYEGTWVGKYKVAGLIPLDDNDTITISFNGNTVTVSSQLLGGETFTATYDPETGDVEIGNINISSITFGDDSFTNISVTSGSLKLRFDCENGFLNLNGVSVGDGTVNLPDPLDYPLGPTTLESTGQGFVQI